LPKHERKEKKVRKSDNIISGTFTAKEAGFGFVLPDDPTAEDVFIPKKYTKLGDTRVMHKDRVQVRIIDKKSGKREGEIVKVLERGHNVIVGEYTQLNGYGTVSPDDKKLCGELTIPQGSAAGAVSGSKVAVRITDYAGNVAQVVSVLGQRNTPGVDVLSILTQLEIPTEFSREALDQADKIPDTVQPNETKGRRDLREKLLFTIDGADAKDIDDAISLEMDGNKYVLGVHIADVTHYVKPNTPIYREALIRGTSVYPADRVVPMLPTRLSNGICSLNPRVDRLALTCEMVINGFGEVESHDIYESVIHSRYRMTYDDVNLIIENDGGKRGEYPDLAPVIDRMATLSQLLRNRRREKGAINFTTTECKIILDEKGEPTDIYPYARNRATDLIEDFMLAANETVARHVFWLDFPFVYRTHDEPDPIKLQAVSETVKKLGYSIRLGKHTGKMMQKLLDQAEQRPETTSLVNRLCLRAMMQARYTPENNGHFGLAMKYYTHFTSPIRRFPDLTVHRILKMIINGKLSDKRKSQLTEDLPDICRQCSKTERRAEEAERETEALKKTQYMASRLGEEFDGTISGVTNFGIFVELPNTVEGMVAVGDLEGDTYVYSADFMRFTGTRTKRTYNLGDTVRVVVARTDVEARKIGFVFANDNPADI
jgi:ribonuclease R